MIDLFRSRWDLAIDDTVREQIAAGAVVAFSMSGGKDSTVAAAAGVEYLDAVGHPPSRRIAVHADLGRAEWKATPAMVEEIAARLKLPLLVVRHGKHDMVSRWEARFAEGKRRYANLEIFNLIGPWSSASLRFCTAELKQQVISPALLRRYPGQTIVSVVGIRREESASRRVAPISKWEPRWARGNGGRMLTWHPAADWSLEEVWDFHTARGLPRHEAYAIYGASRVSCAFCVLQREADQHAATSAETNHDLYRHLVGMELGSTFSFQPTRWLADIAPGLLSDEARSQIGEAKRRGDERRALEAALPAGLRYVKGWPLRLPTQAEAVTVCRARAVILGHHDLPNLYPGPGSVIDRFAELMAATPIPQAAA